MAIGIIALPISLAHNTTSQKRVQLLEREVIFKKLGGNNEGTEKVPIDSF